MKRLILLTIILFATLGAFAQNISVAEFRLREADMTAASLEGKRVDRNGQPAALIRIETTETGFAFEAGTLGIVDSKQETGEVWVWVPRASRKITIKHPQLGVLYDYRYPIEIEAERTYWMKLTTAKIETVVKEQVHQQYLTFQITPPNAMLEVNDELWNVDAEGNATKYVEFGTYTYRVRAADHNTEAGSVTVDDPENTKIVPVILLSNLVEVTLSVPADAEIWVNNELKGVRTWTGRLGKGVYRIECRQAGHETSSVSKEITAEMNGQTITLGAPTSIYGSLNVESTPNMATIYIDGKEMGKTPRSINEILVGQHELRLTKEGYNNYTETITITKGERKQVSATFDDKDYDKIAKQGDDYYDAKNYEEALRCYREAAEHGNAVGQNGMGRLYAGGNAVPQDFVEAVKWYRLAAEQGLDRAQSNLGFCYLQGQGVDIDYAEALRWFRMSEEQGGEYALYGLGCMYYYGYGVTQDYDEALKWFRKAADQGYVDAQLLLGLMYETGSGVSQDYSEAMKWYQKAADQGNAHAQNSLGVMYHNGSGVSVDYEEAMKWYRKAAEQGNMYAQNNIGVLYDFGYGVNQDYSEAMKWYRKAADQGYALAQNSLGVMYHNGKGVSKDYDEAMKWFQKAAEQGNMYAQNNIGVLYEYGEGVRKNKKEAKIWYQKAAAQGYAKAQQALERLK